MTAEKIPSYGSDTALLEEYFDTFRRSEPIEPEKALLNALLADALHDYRKYYAASDRAGRERFREAEEWIMTSGDDWIFSFENVCAMLNLDPDYIRRRLREWNEGGTRAVKTARSDARKT